MIARIIEAEMKEMDVKGRALVLTLASSGPRLDEILYLKISDMDFEATPLRFTIRGTTSQNGQPRFTFISQEAACAFELGWGKLNEYVKNAAVRTKNLVDRGICEAKKTPTDLLFSLNDVAVNTMWENTFKQFVFIPTALDIVLYYKCVFASRIFLRCFSDLGLPCNLSENFFIHQILYFGYSFYRSITAE